MPTIVGDIKLFTKNGAGGIDVLNANFESPDIADGTWDLEDQTAAPFAGFAYQGYYDDGGHRYLVFKDGSEQHLIFSETASAPGEFPATYQEGDIPLITTQIPACFAEGTGIAAPEGVRAVEALRIGDRILTADGRTVAVKWIGRQTVVKWSGVGHVQPVVIRAGALGENVPFADLTVTADHGMVLDGHVINASALVNGGSIDWVPAADLPATFTVYHVETEAHDVILANGAPAETFIDYAGRRVFDNFDEYEALYGEDRSIPEMTHPRVSSARHLPVSIQALSCVGRASPGP
ncbi:Hint domain-containing protein [Mameliella sp.]|uniref:Hint domain-containing protein n=1 Tax=Mameliella sp. TaxID=1924940 RepID=UPI003BAB7FC8